nr:GntR family transcriptional regulator [Jiella flava]
MQANRSIAVPELSLDAYLELLRIRCELEGLAAELAASRAEADGLQGLAALIEAIDGVVAKQDHAEYRRLNQAFHFALYAEARSPRLSGMIRDLWGQTGPYVSELVVSGRYGSQANVAHKRILSALQVGDGMAARAGLIADLASASEYILPSLLRMEAERRERPRVFAAAGGVAAKAEPR